MHLIADSLSFVGPAMFDVNFDSPLFWALVIGWVLSVTLHEFAHGIVAYWGGDWTIRERGGLTLNPLQYIDPVTSLVFPILCLLIGGVPLPGGATFIRRDLLKSREWDSAVSLAGPFMNLLIFFGLAIPLHPKIGWVHNALDLTNAQQLLGALATLQFLAMVFNLIPVPPLDGFQAVAPYMNHEMRWKLSTPPTSTGLFMAFWILLASWPTFTLWIFRMMMNLLGLIGFDPLSRLVFLTSYESVLFGHVQ